MRLSPATPTYNTPNQSMHAAVDAILNCEGLPSPPGVAVKLLRLFGVPNVEVDEIADVINTDPVMAAKLIEYCNSSLYARVRETSSVQQAVVLMGMKAVKILTLSFSLVQIKSTNENSFDYDRFWHQCLAIACASKTICMASDRDGEEEFLLGLMLKCGQIGFAHTYPGLYTRLIEESKESGTSIGELEVREWQLNHFALSAELMMHWNFPEHMYAAVANFNGMQNDVDESTLAQTRTLRLAEMIAGFHFQDEVPMECLESAKEKAFTWFGIANDRFPEMMDQATEMWQQYAGAFSFNAADSETFESLERRAMKRIAQLSMGLHQENSFMQQQNAELKLNAMVDRLTGLKNRRAFDDEAVAEWERAKRLQGSFILAMVDIDHFKNVNDTYGHKAGDACLVEVARVLKEYTRIYDLVFRFGGEEFVIVLPECPPSECVSVLERVRRKIETLKLPVPGGTYSVTASFGVSVHRHPDPGTIDDLLEKADRLLYQVKKDGRNRVRADFICDTNPTFTMMPNPIPPSESVERSLGN